MSQPVPGCSPVLLCRFYIPSVAIYPTGPSVSLPVFYLTYESLGFLRNPRSFPDLRYPRHFRGGSQLLHLERPSKTYQTPTSSQRETAERSGPAISLLQQQSRFHSDQVRTALYGPSILNALLPKSPIPTDCVDDPNGVVYALDLFPKSLPVTRTHRVTQSYSTTLNGP